MRYPHTVTRLRAPLSEDRRGDLRRDWTAAVETPGLRVWVQQRSAAELIDATRDEDRSSWLMFSGVNDWQTADRVVWQGRTYEVDGEPNVLETPRGFHHVEAVLLRVAG